ncbi:MAG: hypothetical protein NXI00_06175 [Cytophagales bacterium]|nr:hypothetical protein [Cytophagales bacterium]
MSNAKRVVNNTVFLYAKLALSAVGTLYATRVLLSNLGIADFGIYNLIAGVVLMLAFINGAMTITTQRYLSFHMAGSDLSILKKIFNSSVSIHFLISVVLIVILEVLRIILFNGFLNIPEDKINEALWCFHLMVVSTFFTVNAVPYDSLINAKEDLIFDSVLGFFETLLKLGAALAVSYFQSDRLIAYSVFIVSITVLIRLLKTLWCKFKYEEAGISLSEVRELYKFKEMLSYASWNLFGSLCYVASSQGVAVVLNRFLGVNINGTYAISQQMNAQLRSFSVIINKALNPQIMKSEGAGDRSRMIRLALLSSKSSSFLLLYIVVPLILEMDNVLALWLGNVPEEAKIFCSIILINAVINQLSVGLKSAVQATGKIKLYQTVVGSIIILIVPITYYLLSIGSPILYVLLASTAMEIMSLFLRLMICRNVIGLRLKRFGMDVMFRFLTVGLITVVSSILINVLMEPSNIRILVSFCMNALVLSIAIFIFGMAPEEKDVLVKIIMGKFFKKKGLIT